MTTKPITGARCWMVFIVAVTLTASTLVGRVAEARPVTDVEFSGRVVSVDPTGRFVVVDSPNGGAPNYQRFDALTSVFTPLPPATLVSDGGWYVVTPERQWVDLITGATTAVPVSGDSILAGEGRTLLVNDLDGRTGVSAVVDLPTGTTERLPLNGRGTAMSANGRYVLFVACRAGGVCDTYRRWDRWTNETEVVGRTSEHVVPAIANTGRVFVNVLSGSQEVSPTIVLRDVGGATKSLAGQRHDPWYASPYFGVTDIAADGTAFVSEWRFTSCCGSASLVQLDSGVITPLPGFSVVGGPPLSFAVSGPGSTVAMVVTAGIGQAVAATRLKVFQVPSAAGIGRLRAGEVWHIPVVGAPGVGSDATAAMLNVTVTDPASAGYLTVYPCADQPPLASNVNFVAGQTVANSVLARLSPAGDVCVVSNSSVDVVVDVEAWFSSNAYHGVVPVRVADTRHGDGDGIGNLAASQVLAVPVRSGAVPADATTVMLNVTATNPESAGYATVWPCGSDRPLASNLNFAPGQTVANAVLATPDGSGDVCIASNVRLDIVVDVQGWATADFAFHAVAPTRIEDSRTGNPPGAAGVPALQTHSVTIPTTLVPDDAAAVMINVTATNAESSGYVTVWPCGQPPLASNLNVAAAQTVANEVLVSLSAENTVCLLSNSSVDYVIDVQGWFAADPGLHTMAPERIEDTRNSVACGLFSDCSAVVAIPA